MIAGTRAAQPASVLIVSGLTREAAILAGPGRLTVCGDAPTLRARLAELADQHFDLVLSWGLCGGLDPKLRPGDLILGAEVVAEDGRIATEQAITSALARKLADTGSRIAVERIAAVRAAVATVREKAELRQSTGAAAVDMESAMVGRFARDRRTPFAVLRAVSDPADRDLPPLVFKALDPNGRIKAAAIGGELLRYPGQFPSLVAAARDGGAAFRALGRCRGVLAGFLLGLRPANL